MPVKKSRFRPSGLTCGKRNVNYGYSSHCEVLGQYRHFTPAMKMGLTSTQLEWRDLIVALIAENAHEFSTFTIL